MAKRKSTNLLEPRCQKPSVRVVQLIRAKCLELKLDFEWRGGELFRYLDKLEDELNERD